VELKHCLEWLGVGILMFLLKLHAALQILQSVNLEPPPKVISMLVLCVLFPRLGEQALWFEWSAQSKHFIEMRVSSFDIG
jgi:hypothetical protein